MPSVSTLNVLLHERLIGTLTRLPDDRTLFAFTKDYITDEGRATLSLSFKDVYGNLITDTKPTRMPSFFSNLLPEGPLRKYLAERAGVLPSREFFLLGVLGRDLPGAIQIVPADGDSWPQLSESGEEKELPPPQTVLRFSLAGVQLKFSAVKDATGGLTIPANGVGGSWIVKLPSTTYAGVPENEYSMMELARRSGIDVPEIKLVSISDISGLPEGTDSVGKYALAIKRFDRMEGGVRVHIEDFAQVFGVSPSEKYEKANYEMIGKVLATEAGEDGVVEFIRRLTFNALIGNGDMHLKNWSVIFPDKRAATIAPAYDFVATAAYIRGEKLALNLGGTKAFREVTGERFDRFADKTKVPTKLVRDAVAATAERFRAAWRDRASLPIASNVEETIEVQLQTVPIANA
jgi:serine/threonine-protein kinase HipA